jgi:L-aspartate oxidase
LTFALKASKFGKVSVVTKADLGDTNTRYAQGGIAAVFSEPDNFEKHIHDTLIAGAGCCNEEVVRMVVREAPARIKDLIDLGVPFDKKVDGTYDLHREAFGIQDSSSQGQDGGSHTGDTDGTCSQGSQHRDF